MGRAAATLGAVAALLAAAPARANMAATQLYPSHFGPPIGARPTGLRVESEKLRFDCEPRGDAPVCRFEAAYAIVNPAAQAERVVGAFYGERVREVTVTLDGAAIGRALTEAEVGSLDAALEEASAAARLRGQPALHLTKEKIERAGFELQVAPGARAALVARGVFEPGERWIPTGYRWAAIEARHLALGKEAKDRFWDLQYLVAPIWTWAGDPTIEVEVAVSRPYRMSVDERWTVEERDGKTIQRRTWKGGEAPGGLGLVVEREAAILENGGVLAGVGYAFGDQAGFRARLGYEAGALGWLLGSLVAETDFAKRVQIVPAIEAASPVLMIIPSAGLGAGVPIQLAPEVRAAVRLQASVMFWPVGAFVAVDLYPEAGASGGFVETSLMFQASF